MASRIEGLNKRYGTQLLVSGSVEEQVREQFLFRPLDLVVPAGTSQIVELFELLGARGGGPDAATEAAIALCAAAGARRSRSTGSATGARHSSSSGASLRLIRPIRVAPIYIARCMRFLANPPPADWDGAEHFSSK